MTAEQEDRDGVDLPDLEALEARLLELERETPSGLLFRGQSNSCWSLDTSLERWRKPGMLVADYYRLISKIKPEIESVTGKYWEIPPYEEVLKSLSEYYDFSLKLSFGQLPAYAYMVYLRHHGFPSPILDWTRSSHVATYFAFRDAQPDIDGRCVSIYVYSEPKFRLHGNKMRQIIRLGPYVRTHRRHFLQQSEYTMCVIYEDEWQFAQHRSVVEDGRSGQGKFLKFNVPATERVKALRRLDKYNMNAFSLFNSEESLMETMAQREFNLKYTQDVTTNV